MVINDLLVKRTDYSGNFAEYLLILNKYTYSRIVHSVYLLF